jgi:5-methyltetrahydropteroyltriglutamate--homocysteine methyltransferase
MTSMVLATNLGFPRVGANRELKKAQEAFWKGKGSESELLSVAKELRLRHWTMQKDAGIDHIPSNDFTLYDHMLDMCCLLGCVPKRYGWKGGIVGLDTFFAMARGNDLSPAMDMTKWFDTNYHYIVPEFEDGQNFTLSSTKIFDQFEEAKAAGIKTRPVLVGPLTFLGLGKRKSDKLKWEDLWTAVMPVYEQVLKKLAAMGAEWVQIDEPCLVMDMPADMSAVYQTTYERLAAAAGPMKIMLATYFDSLGKTTALACNLPVHGLHIDLVRAPGQFDAVLDALPNDRMLSLGVIDGRNIWKADLEKAIGFVERALKRVAPERLMIGPSCSLLHTPIDLDGETKLDAGVKSWMAFAKQKLNEIVAVAKAAREGRPAIATMLAESDKVAADRKTSSRIHSPAVKTRLASVSQGMLARKNPYPQRRLVQEAKYKLPLFPTTSIGSFPQTNEIRAARASFKKGELSAADYDAAMKKEIEGVVRYQEQIDIDVLVHGEAERNDMVEYFGEQLEGFTFTKNGWVQSYGSRCVKPPVIFGDVSRAKPMTVSWSTYAQSLTNRPMKGMLTGPVTILQWSFVRDDQPREMTCNQIALAIRDEVTDLEKAGITIIQIDEPAIREGLPLRKEDWQAYLRWAVDSFLLSSTGVEDSTQIHTHMCYSEFNDIIESVGAMDADVISIETSRSQMELLEAFVNYKYPNEIGPGVYDIHSPRVPSTDEMVALLNKALNVLKPEQIWVNPDCGLKTRGWAETKPALENMVKAAKAMRATKKRVAA